MATKIATWNVNSIRARLPNVTAWLTQAAPDICVLQELKCEEAQFPRAEIEDLGYNLAIIGQKTYNGVAILAKAPIEVELRALPGGEDDAQARYVQALIGGLRVASIYLPNGNPVETDKFAYKLAWMDRLAAHAGTLLALEEATVLAGDYNVCPADEDVFDPQGFAGDALCRPESRSRFWSLLNQGWTDALRLFRRGPHVYTYWDYQAGAWPKDHGLRIDHLLLSPQAADRASDADVDRRPRGQEKASDHTPVWCLLR
ncbi:MAG: exodeoxyribonuclease III [Alphaproteobacteria bacterium]|nr:exodeoxyribonuclease III [Alphaproteobacteria bacterium]